MRQNLISKLFKVLLLVATIRVLDVAAFAQSGERPQLVLAFSASTLGLGVQAARPLTRRSAIHGGFNFYNYNRGFGKDGANYAGQLRLRSITLQYDQYLVAGLHVSGGALIWNGNKADASVSVPGLHAFTLGSATYFSDKNSPISGAAAVRVRKAAPMVLLGYGNLASKGHIAYSVDAGMVFQGSPKTTLSLAGNACPVAAGGGGGGGPCPAIATAPGFQTNLEAQQSRINSDLSPLKYYPVLQFTIGYKIK